MFEKKKSRQPDLLEGDGGLLEDKIGEGTATWMGKMYFLDATVPKVKGAMLAQGLRIVADTNA